MQTFLPYADFAATARALDDKRLGKQRVETLQVVRALTWATYGWQNHPAVRMWRGYEEALGAYGAVICAEWKRRGYADTVDAKIEIDLAAAGVRVPPRSQAELRSADLLPPWLGHEDLHRSHRGALLRKDPDHYGPLFGADEAALDLPYVWPVEKATRPQAARTTT
jgi:hypothetical protein